MEVENDVVAPRISKEKQCCVGGNHSKSLQRVSGQLELERTNTSEWICSAHRIANNQKIMVNVFAHLCWKNMTV